MIVKCKLRWRERERERCFLPNTAQCNTDGEKSILLMSESFDSFTHLFVSHSSAVFRTELDGISWSAIGLYIKERRIFHLYIYSPVGAPLPIDVTMRASFFFCLSACHWHQFHFFLVSLCPHGHCTTETVLEFTITVYYRVFAQKKTLNAFLVKPPSSPPPPVECFKVQ